MTSTTRISTEIKSCGWRPGTPVPIVLPPLDSLSLCTVWACNVMVFQRSCRGAGDATVCEGILVIGQNPKKTNNRST